MELLVSLGSCMAREAELLADPFTGQAFTGQEKVVEFGNEKTLEKSGGSAARTDKASKQKPQY
jgi:hypothetical protein